MSSSGGNAATARWEVPALDGSAGPGYLTAGRLEALQKEAYDEAWQQGFEEGVAAGREDVAMRAGRLDVLLGRLAQPFEELDDTVEKHLVELAMTVVQQLFRRELRQDPSHIVGVVREAIQLLPVASRSVRVRLHPEDAAFVRESLPASEGERAWTIVEDPMIERGGCKVLTEQSQIDAQAESRLKAVIAAVCDERR
jgi:flagellar assembly protein FliH